MKIGIIEALLAFLAASSMIVGMVAAADTPSTTINATLNVSSACTIGGSSFTFLPNPITPGATSTAWDEVLNNTGNNVVVVSVQGADWVPADTHLPVGATSWSLATDGTYAPLTTGAVDTTLSLSGAGTGHIFFKATVPSGTPGKVYTQAITFTGSC